MMRRIARFIHEQPGWPELTWDAGALAATLSGARHRQGRLIGKMEALGSETRDEANLETLTSDVVRSSAIEGEVLAPDEVRSSIARQLGLDVGGLHQTSRAVDGVVEVVLDATQRFAEGLTAERLFAWHAALFPTGRSGMRRIAVGEWRTRETWPMQVVSGPLGRETVHFEAPDPDRVAPEMARFVQWFEERPPQAVRDPVVTAAVAHLWFLTIHPFEDGNGRIARAIADMALARADQTQGRFYSMASQIEAERRDYYLELEAAQRGGLDVTRWVAWFLGCLDRAVGNADARVAAALHKESVWRWVGRQPINARQRAVISRLLDDFKGHLTTSKYAKLAKCSSDTALRDIEWLIAWGLLVKNPSGGRSTSYRLADMPAG